MSDLPTASADGTDEVTCEDIAKARGWHRTTAWRWLRELEKKHGPTVVSRRGNRLFTTRAALASVAIGLSDEERTRLDRRMPRLEARMATVERELSMVKKELREFRRKSYEWLRRNRPQGA